MDKKYNRILKKAFPGLRDVVGIDLGASAVKAVRLKKDSFGKTAVVAAAVLPVYNRGAATGPVALPKSLCAWSAAIAIPSRKGLIKLLPQSPQLKDEDMPELLGLPKVNDYRIAACKIGEGKQAPLLVAGIPGAEAENLQAVLPAGKPLLASAGLSGLASISAYMYAFKGEYGEGCDLVIDTGRESMTMGVFHQGVPCVIRQFETGISSLENAVAEAFSCDMTTVRDILISGEVDIGNVIQNAYSNLLRQASIAVDFSERRTSSRLARIFLTGGLSVNGCFKGELQNSFGIAPVALDSWKGMTVPAAVAAEVGKNAGCSFAAATASALAVLEDN